MKTFKYCLFVVLLCLLTENTYAQQQAYIYMDSVYTNLNNYDNKYKDYIATKRKYNDELKEKEKNLNARFDALILNYGVQKNETLDQVKLRMNSRDLELLKILQDENTFLESMSASYTKLLEDQFQTDIQPFIHEVKVTIEAYAVKNKLDFVWMMDIMKGDLVYVNKGKDITEIIVSLVNANLKKK